MQQLSEFSSLLTTGQLAALSKGHVRNVSDLLLSTPANIAKRTKISLFEVHKILDIISKEIACPTTNLKQVLKDKSACFTTGDLHLDEKLGGGICTGMVWEVVGESGSGKSQLAMQLALMVQIPQNLGGLNGATCYLTTHTHLPTKRLVQLCKNHPLLSASICTLSDIQTQIVSTFDILKQSLCMTFPLLVKRADDDPQSRPIKLLIIDTASALLRLEGGFSDQSLVERSKTITELSVLLHDIATKYKIAVVVLNEVTDVFENPIHMRRLDTYDIFYNDQKKFFGSPSHPSSDDKKEAALGLVWSNQINVRIFLTRTNRRKVSSIDSLDVRDTKRRRTLDSSTSNENDIVKEDVQDDLNQPALIRRFAVIFSSVSSPVTVDYIITSNGINSLSEAQI